MNSVIDFTDVYIDIEVEILYEAEKNINLICQLPILQASCTMYYVTSVLYDMRQTVKKIYIIIIHD